MVPLIPFLTFWCFDVETNRSVYITSVCFILSRLFVKARILSWEFLLRCGYLKQAWAFLLTFRSPRTQTAEWPWGHELFSPRPRSWLFHLYTSFAYIQSWYMLDNNEAKAKLSYLANLSSTTGNDCCTCYKVAFAVDGVGVVYKSRQCISVYTYGYPLWKRGVGGVVSIDFGPLLDRLISNYSSITRVFSIVLSCPVLFLSLYIYIGSRTELNLGDTLSKLVWEFVHVDLGGRGNG